MPERNETNHDRFRRVAEARTRKLLHILELLGNCSRKATYEYTEEEVEQIFIALENGLSNAKACFNEAKCFSLRE